MSVKADKLPLWQDAASFAARSHRNQVRKDGRTPYFAHCVRVAFTISQVFGCDDEVAITAALLHDTIEDTTTDYEDISEHFGEEVAEIVAAVTKNMALPEKEREREYDERLSKADWRARLIKLGDTYDNLCDAVTVPQEEAAKRKRESRERAERALELAKADAGNACVDRAVGALKKLLA